MPGAANRVSSRAIVPTWLLLLPLPLLALACENTPTPVYVGKTKGSTGPAQPTGTAEKPYTPPQVTAKISQVKMNWKDRQQTFTITLTNNGDKQEIIHAVVYGTNNETNPPRRGISPPTATDWFGLINSRDGTITPADIERSWKTAGFLSARGGKLRRTWDEKVDAGKTIEVSAAHDLDDKSPHPQWKGKALANVPYTEYHLWLFSADGFCFFEEKVPAFGGPVVKDTRPDPKKTPDTKVADTRPTPTPTKPEAKPVNPKEEAQAATELRLATTYLEMNRRQDARDKLNLILKKFPDTDAAKKARDLLDRIPQ